MPKCLWWLTGIVCTLVGRLDTVALASWAIPNSVWCFELNHPLGTTVQGW